MAATDALWCIVPAAGKGQRFGTDLPKQYQPLAGRPLLMHTLERLADCTEIRALMVVLAADDRHWPGTADIAGKPVRTAIGAAERSGSVLAGLRALPAEVGNDDFVLVHDAARPCIAPADIARLVALGVPAGGALLAARVSDTLKRADASERVAATEPREKLWRALTPQMFRRGELTAALERAERERAPITDEAMAIERQGGRPLLVEGAGHNIKVTTREDLALAAALLNLARE